MHGHGLGVLGYGKNLPAVFLPFIRSREGSAGAVSMCARPMAVSAPLSVQSELQHVRERSHDKWHAQKARAEGLEKYTTELTTALRWGTGSPRERAGARNQSLARTMNAHIAAVTETRSDFGAHEHRAEALQAQAGCGAP